MAYVPTETDTPFDRFGGAATGAETVRALAEHFYDAMSRTEPALAQLHSCDPDGRVDQGSRDRFAMFLVGWLGGPQDYTAQHGHPRLRMRHAHLPLGTEMRDAWLRAMRIALDECAVEADVRAYLDARFTEVAEMLRNRV